MSKKVYKIHSWDFKINETYTRISLGVYFDKNLKPYTKDFLMNIMSHFSEREEYEKCLKIKNMIDKRFNHEVNFTDLK